MAVTVLNSGCLVRQSGDNSPTTTCNRDTRLPGLSGQNLRMRLSSQVGASLALELPLYLPSTWSCSCQAAGKCSVPSQGEKAQKRELVLPLPPVKTQGSHGIPDTFGPFMIPRLRLPPLPLCPTWASLPDKP